MTTIRVETYGVVAEDEPDAGLPCWCLFGVGIAWIQTALGDCT